MSKNLDVLDANARFSLSGVLTVSISGVMDDWNPTGLNAATVIRINPTASSQISGIAGGVDGRILVLQNVNATNQITIASTSTTPAYRFTFPTWMTTTFIMYPGDIFILIYDGTTSRWKFLTFPRKYASKTDMETPVDNHYIVSPGQVNHHPGVSGFYARMTISGTTVTKQGSWNITSVSRNGTGDYTYTIGTDLSTGEACLFSFASDTSSGGGARAVFGGANYAIAAGSVRFRFSDGVNYSDTWTDVHLGGFGTLSA